MKFEGAKVTSKSFEKAEFNRILTKDECPTCGEDDKVRSNSRAILTDRRSDVFVKMKTRTNSKKKQFQTQTLTSPFVDHLKK